MNDSYECSICKLTLPNNQFHENNPIDGNRKVAYACKECRSWIRYFRRYPVPCSECKRHRKLDGNGQCRECNGGLEQMGLRPCNRCLAVLPIAMNFYGKRRICKDCLTYARKGL